MMSLMGKFGITMIIGKRKMSVDEWKQAMQTTKTLLHPSIKIHRLEKESIPLNKTNPMFTPFFFILNTENTRL